MHSAEVANIAKNVTLSAGGVAVYGGWTANEVAAVGGLLVAFAGLCVQFYYKRKADKRAHALYEKRMAAIDSGEDEDDGED